MEDITSIKLISEEGKEHDCPVEFAKMSGLIMNTIDESLERDEPIEAIPVPKVSDNILDKVIEFGKHYQIEEMTELDSPLKSSRIEELVQDWYVEFMNVDQEVLFQLVAAANYMDIKELLDLACLGLAILCQNKSEDELRKIFKTEKNLQNERNLDE